MFEIKILFYDRAASVTQVRVGSDVARKMADDIVAKGCCLVDLPDEAPGTQIVIGPRGIKYVRITPIPNPPVPAATSHITIGPVS